MRLITRSVQGLRHATLLALLVGGVVLMPAIPSGAQQKTDIVRPLTVDEFLELPDQAQSLYLGGLIEGMVYMAYGYSLPEHHAWAACLHSQSLTDTRRGVVVFLRQHPDFDEGVASALAQTMGKRCTR